MRSGRQNARSGSASAPSNGWPRCPVDRVADLDSRSARISESIVASRLGGGSYHHITATGDTVNVASRLMEVAANHGVQLAVSNELLRAAGRDCAVFKSGVLTGPNETRIRGRSRLAPVWLWRSSLSP